MKFAAEVWHINKAVSLDIKWGAATNPGSMQSALMGAGIGMGMGGGIQSS